MESLVKTHPAAVDATLGKELSWELDEKPSAHGVSILLQSVSHAPGTVACVFLPRLRAWLDAGGDRSYSATELARTAERLRQVTGVILRHGNEDEYSHLLAVANQRLEEALPAELAFVWLATLMRIEPELGVSALENQIQAVEPAERSSAITWFAVLFGDRQNAIVLRDRAFTPQLLLRLLRLAFHHVRLEDDAEHEGSYEPDARDYAERARNEIVGALLDAEGEEGWAAKLEMAADPACVHINDRILAVADEKWAHEMDAVAFNESQAVALDRTGEAPATTNEAMFAIMRDRLADLDELLRRDASPRESWAGIKDERVMRREVARELSHTANGLYKVDQEAVTADEKETDIRLRSIESDYEAVIELKLADNRSVNDLRNTISDQLVGKYLTKETSRSGCLLVTLARNRTWVHPDSGKRIDPLELKSLLGDEANRVEEGMGGAVALYVHFLDL